MKAIIVAGIAIEVCALLGAASVRAAGPVEDQASALEELREARPQTAPVEIDGHILFWVVGTKSFPAGDRARAIRDNIVALARDPGVRSETVQVSDTQFSTKIVSGERLVMPVVDADARIEGLGRQVVASAHAMQIRMVIERYRRDRNPKVLLAHALYAAAATAGVFLALRLALRALRRTQRFIEARYKTRIRAVTIQAVEVIQTE
jgi:hypothetical protein